MDEGHWNIRYFQFANLGDYWVLDTDYENYSVIWNCSDYSLFHFEYVQILARDPSYTPDESLMQMIANNTNLTDSDFISIDNTRCPAKNPQG